MLDSCSSYEYFLQVSLKQDIELGKFFLDLGEPTSLHLIMRRIFSPLGINLTISV